MFKMEKTTLNSSYSHSQVDVLDGGLAHQVGGLGHGAEAQTKQRTPQVSPRAVLDTRRARHSPKYAPWFLTRWFLTAV